MVESAFTRTRIERIAADALRAAGVLGVVPTPLEALRGVAGVTAVEPIAAVPHPRRPLLGALWFGERTMFLDERQSEPRRRFTEAHELMHALCPWHEAALRLDGEAELFRATAAAIEAEANLGASLLIFQGRPVPGPLTLDRALALAARHGASAHAALHHLVETHERPAALLTTGRFPQRDGSLPVWRSVASPALARAQLPATLGPRTPLRELAEAARQAGRAATRLRLGARPFAAEAYDNRHAFLVLLTA